MLDVRRHPKNRLAEIHRLADGLEARRAGVCLAGCHLIEECHVVNLMETECRVDDGFLICPLFVPEEAERNGGIIPMSCKNVLAEA